MGKDEKIRRTTWRVARLALESGEWALTQHPQRAAELVDLANVVVTSLAGGGCLADEYGEGGSLEVEIACGYVAKIAGGLSYALRGPAQMPQAPVHWYCEQIFAHVRDLDAAGLLSPEDRARARVFEADAEAACEAKRKSEEAEREAKRRREAERRERAARREAAARRLAEIAQERKEAK